MIALMTDGTLSTSEIPVTPASVWTRMTQLSYDPSKVSPAQPGTRSSIASMSVIFIAASPYARFAQLSEILDSGPECWNTKHDASGKGASTRQRAIRGLSRRRAGWLAERPAGFRNNGVSTPKRRTGDRRIDRDHLADSEIY